MGVGVIRVWGVIIWLGVDFGEVSGIGWLVGVGSVWRGQACWEVQGFGGWVLVNWRGRKTKGGGLTVLTP